MAAEGTAGNNATVAPLPVPPRVFVIQGFHVSPSMPIDSKVQEIWTLQIRERLSNLLLQGIPTGTCVQEFMMAGKRPNCLRPTVVLTCGDARTKRGVKHLAKRQSWLQCILKEKGIDLVALVARVALSTSPVLTSDATASWEENSRSQILEGTAATSCGLCVRITFEDHSQRFCMLGGLLIVNDEIFGLTAAHPFIRGQEHQPSSDLSQGSGRSITDSEDENEGDSVTSSQPYLTNFEESNDDQASSSASLPLFSNVPDAIQSLTHEPSYEPRHATSAASESRGTWSKPLNVIYSLSSSPKESSLHGWDGALLGDLPRSVATLPNKMGFSNDIPDSFVESIMLELHRPEVYVMISNTDALPGHCHSVSADIIFHGSISSVRLITLEHTVPRGCSGAWVVCDQKLCGIIVAVRQDLPWVYMVPIGPILEDIKAKIGTNDVRLPRVGETISRFTGGTDVGSLVDSASYTTPVATVPQSYHLVSPLNLDGPVLSSKDQLIQYLRSNRYNTIIDLRRVERILAQSDDAAISETMSSAWRSYVDSHSLLSELRGLTRNYPFSSECLDEAKILVLEDPKSVRSWNYCWMILVKIQSERLIQKHASAMATKPEMWGNQTPTPQHVELLYQRLVAEWTRAVLQMLKLWDQPPSMTDH